MCVFCFTSNENCHLFLGKKNGDPAKRVVDFPRERDTFRNKFIEIVDDFDEQSTNNNGKPWKSSGILRVNPFFHFSFFFHLFSPFFFFFFTFFHFFHFFIFLHFLSLSLIFLIFSMSFIFFSFFMFFHVLSFSFIFYHFLPFSFIFFVGCSKSDFFGPQFRYDFS